jgi:hypothetical protein
VTTSASLPPDTLPPEADDGEHPEWLKVGDAKFGKLVLEHDKSGADKLCWRRVTDEDEFVTNMFKIMAAMRGFRGVVNGYRVKRKGEYSILGQRWPDLYYDAILHRAIIG